jgi:hypothetical protein
MLLLDDDDELPIIPGEDEARLSAQFSAAALGAIDGALMAQARGGWCKVARVVHDAIEANNLPLDDACIALHVRRLINIVESRALESQGNLRKPRWSEVRLVSAK